MIRSNNNRFKNPGKRLALLFYSTSGRKRATLHNLSPRLLSEKLGRELRTAVQRCAHLRRESEFKFLRNRYHKTKFNINKVSRTLYLRALLPAANSLQKRRNGFTSCLSNLFIREKPFKFAIKSVANVMRGVASSGKALNGSRRPFYARQFNASDFRFRLLTR